MAISRSNRVEFSSWRRAWSLVNSVLIEHLLFVSLCRVAQPLTSRLRCQTV